MQQRYNIKIILGNNVNSINAGSAKISFKMFKVSYVNSIKFWIQISQNNSQIIWWNLSQRIFKLLKLRLNVKQENYITQNLKITNAVKIIPWTWCKLDKNKWRRVQLEVWWKAVEILTHLMILNYGVNHLSMEH